jgi:hypothetical protein
VALSCIVPDENVLLAEVVVELKPVAPAGDAKLRSKAHRMPTAAIRLQRRTTARATFIVSVRIGVGVGGRVASIGRPQLFVCSWTSGVPPALAAPHEFLLVPIG